MNTHPATTLLNVLTQDLFAMEARVESDMGYSRTEIAIDIDEIIEVITMATSLIQTDPRLK